MNLKVIIDLVVLSLLCIGFSIGFILACRVAFGKSTEAGEPASKAVKPLPTKKYLTLEEYRSGPQ